MMSYLASALLLSTASAFAPAARPAVTTRSLVLNAYDAKTMPGNTGPLGFFDPLGLCPDNEKKFKRYRESELKHGRVAMLAVLGVLVGESGFNFFGNDITGPAIFQYQQAESFFTAWSYNVIGFVTTVELFNIVTGWESVDEALSSSEGNADLKENYINGTLNSHNLNML